MLLLVPVSFQRRRKVLSACSVRKAMSWDLGNASVPRWRATYATPQRPCNNSRRPWLNTLLTQAESAGVHRLTLNIHICIHPARSLAPNLTNTQYVSCQSSQAGDTMFFSPTHRAKKEDAKHVLESYLSGEAAFIPTEGSVKVKLNHKSINLTSASGCGVFCRVQLFKYHRRIRI